MGNIIKNFKGDFPFPNVTRRIKEIVYVRRKVTQVGFLLCVCVVIKCTSLISDQWFSSCYQLPPPPCYHPGYILRAHLKLSFAQLMMMSLAVPFPFITPLPLPLNTPKTLKGERARGGGGYCLQCKKTVIRLFLSSLCDIFFSSFISFLHSSSFNPSFSSIFFSFCVIPSLSFVSLLFLFPCLTFFFFLI